VQVLLFSATFPERVETFANKFAPVTMLLQSLMVNVIAVCSCGIHWGTLQSAVKIQIKTEQLSLDNITQFSVQCST